MEIQNWIKWLQARIPELRIKHNESWLRIAFENFYDQMKGEDCEDAICNDNLNTEYVASDFQIQETQSEGFRYPSPVDDCKIDSSDFKDRIEKLNIRVNGSNPSKYIYYRLLHQKNIIDSPLNLQWYSFHDQEEDNFEHPYGHIEYKRIEDGEFVRIYLIPKI